MNESFKCEIEGCNNNALLLFKNKWICGECYLKLQKLMENKFWEDAECALKK